MCGHTIFEVVNYIIVSTMNRKCVWYATHLYNQIMYEKIFSLKVDVIPSELDGQV